jgi:inner membrane protein
VDYITHNLFGVAIYGAQKKTNMDWKMQVSLFAVSVGSSVIPDIDIQWADKLNTSYLLSHRGITHSLLMAPVWAGLFWLLCYLIFRIRSQRLFFTGLIGVLLHIVSDWTNAWGTGLLEPFTSRRYAIGIIPNKGYIFWGIAAITALLFLVYRKPDIRPRVFRAFWALSAVYVCFQIAHSAYVYTQLKTEGYERVAIRADRMPGGMSYYANKDNTIIEGRHEMGGGTTGIVQRYRNDPVDLDLLKQDSRARAILLFAPFVATQDLGDSIRVFDPRFAGRLGLLDITVPKGS